MLTKVQILKIKNHSKEAVESLPDNHKWIHYLGSLDVLCDTALALFDSISQSNVELDACNCGSKKMSQIYMPVKGIICPDCKGRR